MTTNWDDDYREQQQAKSRVDEPKTPAGANVWIMMIETKQPYNQRGTESENDEPFPSAIAALHC